VEIWIEKTPWESVSNRRTRIGIIRNLGKYMIRIGYSAYVVPGKIDPVQDYLYSPYIFSDKELGSILSSIDLFCKETPV